MNARTLAGKRSLYSSNHSHLRTYHVGFDRPFVLLAGTTIGLLIIIVGSIGLLYKVGENALPSTLTGSVGGLKRD